MRGDFFPGPPARAADLSLTVLFSQQFEDEPGTHLKFYSLVEININKRRSLAVEL